MSQNATGFVQCQNGMLMEWYWSLDLNRQRSELKVVSHVMNVMSVWWTCSLKSNF